VFLRKQINHSKKEGTGNMYSRTSLVITTLILGTSLAVHGQTIQELGLPSPVAYEAVFPSVSFGGEEVELRSEVVLANPTEEDAFVELILYDNAGQEVRLAIVSESEYPYNGRLDSFLETIVRAGTAKTLGYPQENYRLLYGFFVGWLQVRSNQPIVVSHKLRSMNRTKGFRSTVNFLGNTVGARSARIRHNEGTYHTEGEDTGIALVNPGDDEIILTAQQIDRSDDVLRTTKVQLPSRSQKVFFQHDIFGLSPHGWGRDSWSGWIEFASNNGSRFAVIGLSLLNFYDGRYPIYSLLPDPVKTDDAQPWDFPVQIVDQFETEALRVFVTAFGFFLTDPSLGKVRKFDIMDGESVVGDEAAGIAVVSGYLGTSGGVDKTIIFLDSENVLMRKMERDIHSISVLPSNQVELITVTWSAYSVLGSLIHEFLDPPTPPWREP
jgi:hypothetical protein